MDLFTLRQGRVKFSEFLIFKVKSQVLFLDYEFFVAEVPNGFLIYGIAS